MLILILKAVITWASFSVTYGHNVTIRIILVTESARAFNSTPKSYGFCKIYTMLGKLPFFFTWGVAAFQTPRM